MERCARETRIQSLFDFTLVLLYWMAYYYTRHPKGRFELSHILQLLAFWAVCILMCEMVLYLWLNG
ncbi:Uncharacterised protein [Bacteroides xylanisolvens]|nr:Uncharacterised protein [Bacteroides xylanisolvens]